MSLIVVSDTSPISALLIIGRVDILSKLFGTIVIPSAVSVELLRYHQTIPEHVEIRTVRDAVAVSRFSRDLDPGEAEGIVLALELKADALLMDESLGRKYARAENIPVIGLMGVLIMAKEKNIISKVLPLIVDLEIKAGFYLSQDVKKEVLRKVGESPP